MAIKKREVEYKVCDKCLREERFVYKCEICGGEFCTSHIMDPGSSNNRLCYDCLSEPIELICSEYDEAWKKLRKRQDKECTIMMKQYSDKIDKLIEEEKQKQ